MSLKITLIGAGSKEFGPATINDVLLSDPLCGMDLELMLMDIDPAELKTHQQYAEDVAQRLKRQIRISHTTDLTKSLDGAAIVISAIELNRYYYWSQDFHIPRKYGFRQIYGENGGPGGLFHALRNFGPMHDIARAMERTCPDAWLLNFTNPLTKLCEMLHHCSDVKFIGLCHGIMMGKNQIARFMNMEVDDLKAYASGLNHFSWFQSIEHAKTGEDLYPRLREIEKNAHWLAEWDEIALSRTLLRTFGLYPSPGTNHIGEYVRWASGFLASSQLQYFYDPAQTDPWRDNNVPTYLYNLDTNPTAMPFHPEKRPIALYNNSEDDDQTDIRASGELAINIVEGLVCGIESELAAINMVNSSGAVPGLPLDAIVEMPATVDQNGITPMQMPQLPEGPLAFLRTQCSIHKLLVDAYKNQSRNSLLQAMLLDPFVDSYQNAVHLINEMCELQKSVLPKMDW